MLYRILTKVYVTIILIISFALHNGKRTINYRQESNQVPSLPVFQYFALNFPLQRIIN
uniref:Hypothetical secreted peptide n=1 Tax=Glossina morsitans morsitans TaxID=37546 RepID=D3TSP4_GLOMM